MQTVTLYVSEVIKPSNLKTERVDRGYYRMELSETELKDYLYRFSLKEVSGQILGNGPEDQGTLWGEVLRDLA